MFKDTYVPGTYSPTYLDWVKSPEFKRHFGERGLTNTQHQFAEWCIVNQEELIQIGDLDTVFISIRSYLKHNNK